MIIKSSFKDYYDFVATRYGGGDPKVVYVRGKVGEGQRKRRGSNEFEQLMEKHRHLSIFNHQFFYEDRTRNGATTIVINRAILVFVGRCFPLIDTREKLGTGATWKIDVEMIERRTPKFHECRRGEKYPEFGIEGEPWISLCKAEMSPVFILYSGSQREICVEYLVPKLDKLGLPSFVSAEQAYQQIAYYVGNVCRESVDVKPPVEVGNKDKIVGHGFDLVTSFRGRVK